MPTSANGNNVCQPCTHESRNGIGTSSQKDTFTFEDETNQFISSVSTNKRTSYE
jgi:hypothetical protein